MYSDQTVLTKGPHKFVALSRVPVDYLLRCYQYPNPNCQTWDRDLHEYIERNLERIYARKEGCAETPPLNWPCAKITYVDKREANSALHHIQFVSKAAVVPVRSYECDRCGFWHLTSQAKETYEALGHAT